MSRRRASAVPTTYRSPSKPSLRSPPSPLSEAGPTYLDVLPIDVYTVILPYVVYQRTTNLAHLSTTLCQLGLGRLLSTVMWARLLAAYPRIMYRTYWASNNYAASQHLDHYGEINYEGLYAAVNHRLLNAQLDGQLPSGDLTVEQSPPSAVLRLKKVWVAAMEERLDLLLVHLRLVVADTLEREWQTWFQDDASVAIPVRLGPHPDGSNSGVNSGRAVSRSSAARGTSVGGRTGTAVSSRSGSSSSGTVPAARRGTPTQFGSPLPLNRSRDPPTAATSPLRVSPALSLAGLDNFTDLCAYPCPRLEQIIMLLLDAAVAHGVPPTQTCNCGQAPGALHIFLHLHLGVVNYPFLTTLTGRYGQPQLPLSEVDLRELAERKSYARRWVRRQLRAALVSDDITVFTTCYRAIGYSEASIRTMLRTAHGPILSTTLAYRYDCLTLVQYFELWPTTAALVVEHILGRAPRLQVGLWARGFRLSLTQTPLLRAHGRIVPAELAPFLPPTITPADIVQLVEATAGNEIVYWAAMRGCSAPFTLAQYKHLLQAQYRGVTIRLLLPPAHLDHPDLRNLVDYMLSERVINPHQSVPALLNYCFLTHFVRLGRAPVVPYATYSGHDIPALHYLSPTGQPYRNLAHCQHQSARGGRNALRFLSRPWARVLALRHHNFHLSTPPVTRTHLLGRTPPCADGARLLVLVNSATQRQLSAFDSANLERASFSEQQRIHTLIYIPAQSTCTLTNVDTDSIMAVLDYDIDDYTWLRSTLISLAPL